tara:strand:- start:66 stop:338 length:273 start_codon:yes stop_codon:yes gene_type:complete
MVVFMKKDDLEQEKQMDDYYNRNRSVYLGGHGIIRVIIGFILILSGVGAEEYAMDTGGEIPSLLYITTMNMAGLLVMYWGFKAIKRTYMD